MKLERAIVAALVSMMRADTAFLSMLGASATLHVEAADDPDATIVRGGTGRCLVRPAPTEATIPRSLGTSARVAYAIELAFEALGVGGKRMATRSAIRSALVNLLGDNGDALLATIGAHVGRLGMSGHVTLVNVLDEPAPDIRSARVLATISVEVWQAIPEV